MDGDRQGQGIVLGPGDGDGVSALGTRITFKATGADTAGAYSVIEYLAPPASPGPPPHLHHHTDEAFYVLDGEVTFQMNGSTTQAGAGSFVFVPRGVPHTFSNPGDRPARFLEIMSPAGFEGYFRELAGALPAGGGPPEAKVVQALYEKYDIVPVASPGH